MLTQALQQIQLHICLLQKLELFSWNSRDNNHRDEP